MTLVRYEMARCARCKGDRPHSRRGQCLACERRDKGLKSKRKLIYRTVRHGEPIPDGEPKRRRASGGYIRLEWRECGDIIRVILEHRLVMGNPHPRFDVHHINGVKTDNRPENLQLLTRSDHIKLHAEQGGAARASERYRKLRNGEPTASEASKARRLEREQEARERVGEMRRLYAGGLTTTEIGQRVGLHPSGVSRHLREAGVLLKHRNRAAKAALPNAQQIVKVRSGLHCERCGVSVKWSGGQVHHRLPRGAGGTSRVEINSPANLLHLCDECHAWVESNRTEAYEKGWLVRQAHVPAERPVLTHEYGWVLLSDSGDRTPYLGEATA
jgi:5-methylcytosine-specific restriction protein A